jgi:membrane protease YdiL (CAAX protease family)
VGEALAHLLSRRVHAVELIGAAVIVSGLAWTAWHFLKKRTPLDDEPDDDSPPPPSAR